MLIVFVTGFPVLPKNCLVGDVDWKFKSIVSGVLEELPEESCVWIVIACERLFGAIVCGWVVKLIPATCAWERIGKRKRKARTESFLILLADMREENQSENNKTGNAYEKFEEGFVEIFHI